MSRLTTIEHSRIVNEGVAYIYALATPLKHRIFYVGLTADLRQRYVSHLANGRLTANNHHDTRAAKVMRAILKRGMVAELVILERTTTERGPSRERRWARSLHCKSPLANSRELVLTPDEKLSAIGVNARLLAMVELAASTLRDSGLLETATTLQEEVVRVRALNE